MKPSSAILISSFVGLIGSANALPTSQNGTVNWAPCPQQNASTPVQCGTLTVPLDYSDSTSSRTLDLQLVKVSAVNQPRKGSILINPGGPGEGGRNIVGEMGDDFLITTGGYHDIIGFDPRGTGFTIPFSCYNTSAERSLAYSPWLPRVVNSSDTALGQIWAGKVANAEACFENNQEYGELLGTAFVARDMLQIAEALDDDGLLRYWGFSYGTVLGATAAAMFPDKIASMVNDGVVNSHQWYGGSSLEAGVQADTVLNGFFEGCMANPNQCPLAQDGDSAEELSQMVYQALDVLKFNPFIITDDPSTGLVNYDGLKGTIFRDLYSPAPLWLVLGGLLHALVIGNLTLFAEAFAPSPPSSRSFSPGTPDALYGILCGDASLRSDDLAALRPLVDATVASSRISGDSFAVTYGLSCAPWRFTAKERYSGNFQAQTKNPILFIGSPFDPVTPLVSARNMSAGFEGSVVLQHSGYGHTSFAQVSLCTARNIRAYFTNGTLPAPGTVCQPDQVLFTDETTLQSLEPLLDMTKRALEHDDDAKLFAAIKNLNQHVGFGPRF